MKKVSIIIVNHNGKLLLKACLESLYKQFFKGIEIIVADNASGDGSLEYVKDSFNDVNVISFPKHIGFAGAHVEALKYTHGDYILLLNNDVAVDNDCMGNLFSTMEEHPDVGIGATKMIAHGKNIMNKKRVDSRHL